MAQAQSMIESTPAPKLVSSRTMLSLALLGFGLVLVFWLPTRFPPPVAASESYCFGFNNRVAQLGFGCVLLLAGVLARLDLFTWPVASRAETTGSGGLSGRLLAVCLGLSAVLCAGMCWLTEGLGGINDSTYYLDRIHLLMRGETPVRDFEFIYGMGPLYGSAAIARVLHVSANAAYFAIWVGATLLGMLLLWLSVRWLEVPAGGKRTVFLLCYTLLTLLIFGATLNYCALRYTLALFGLVGISRIDREDTPLRRIGVLLFAGLTMAMLLFYSPEQGLVYAIAVCAYLPVRRYFARRAFLLDMLGLLVVAAGVVALAAHAGTFATMKRVGAGGSSLPVYPGPHILLGFASMIAVVCYLISGMKARRLQSNVSAALIYSIGMLPGALGRCDAIHIFGYLLPCLLCAMLLAWGWPKVWRVAVVAFAAFFIAVPWVLGVVQSPPILTKAVLLHLYENGVPQSGPAKTIDTMAARLAVRAMGQQRGMAKMTSLRNSATAVSVDPRVVFPGSSERIAVPFEYLPNKLNNYQAPWIDEGYFMGTEDIFTPADVQRKVDELAAHPDEDLVISKDNFDQCLPQGGSRSEVRSLLLLPWVPKAKTHFTVFVPYCEYLEQHYHFVVPPTPTTFGYGLMRHNSNDSH